MDKIVKILKIEQLAQNVKRFTIEKPTAYQFEIGNAAMLAVNQPKWANKKRPFTFTSLPEETTLEFIIKSYPEHNGVTKKLHELHPGDELVIEEPFTSLKYKGPGVFLAGGIGIAAFIAMFKQLSNEGKIKECQLLYSSRTKRDIILEDWLKTLFKGVKNGLILTLTREQDKNYLTGRIDRNLIKKYVKDFTKNFYVCGPPSFVSTINAIVADLKINTQIVLF